MRKLFCFLLLGLVVVFTPLRAQLTPAEKSEAERLVGEIENRSFLDTLSQPALVRLIELYEKHEFKPRLVEWYGRRAIFTDSSSIELADRAISIAYTELGDSLHLLTRWAYYIKANTAEDLDRRIELADLALNMKDDDALALQLLVIKSTVYHSYPAPDQTAALIPLAEAIFGKLSSTEQRDYRPTLTAIRLDNELASKQYDQAKLYGQLLLDQIETSEIFGLPMAMSTCYSLSFTNTQIGRLEEAMNWALRGLALSDQDTQERMACNYAMGIAYRRAGDPERAIPYLQDALDGLLRKVYGSAEEISTIANELSRAHTETGNQEKALEVGAVVLENAPSSGAYINYAGQLGRSARFEEGLGYLQKALQLGFADFTEENIAINPNTEITGDFRSTITALYLKSIFAMEHVKRDGADTALLAVAHEAIDLAISQLSAPFTTSPGLRSAELLGTNDQYNYFLVNKSFILYQRYLNSSDNAFMRQFLHTSEQIKAQTLTKSLEQPSLPESVVEESRQLEMQRSELQQRLDLAISEAEQRNLRNELIELGELIRVFTEKIAGRYSREQGYFYDVDYTDFTTIESQLADDEIILNYSFYEFPGKVFLSIAEAGGSHLVELDSVANLKEHIFEYLDLLHSPLLQQKAKKERFIALSRKLYKGLVQPAEAYLNGKHKIVVFPDNSLGVLPFESLLASETSLDQPFTEMDFLLKKAAISYYPSGTVYNQLKRKKSIQDNSYLAYAPVFNDSEDSGEIVAGMRDDFSQDTTTRSLALTADGFSPLPNSRKEVTTIYEILGKEANRKLLLNEKATISALKAESERSLQFLHIATHGLANRNNPRLSALAGYENGEQALLYANEIQFLPLNVDLAILSSCDSGIGRQSQGEGIVALNRTFLYAGARNVISSLWKVSDRYSSELMIGFYRNYLVSNSYRAALRSAKLELLKNAETALPRYWAAFLLVGE